MKFVTYTCLIFFYAVHPSAGQSEYAGEYTDIRLGRDLINRDSFPSLKEFESYAEQNDTSAVLMFSLIQSDDNLINPNWSVDGRRLSFQVVKKDRGASNISVYDHMGMKNPSMLSTSRSDYDSMFRWAIGSHSAFIFNRLGQRGGKASFLGNFNNEQDPGKGVSKSIQAKPLGLSGKLYENPAIYVRTDKIARIAFDEVDQIMRVASRNPGKVSAARKVIQGQTPRWKRDGRHLLAIERNNSGSTTGRMASVNILNGDIRYFGPVLSHARSPCWSPDEKWVSCYVRKSASSSKWSISVVSASPTSNSDAKIIDDDVIVNANFETQGPCWNPEATQLWYFSNQQRKEAYYPLVVKQIESGKTEIVNYPPECTSPKDLVINPASEIAPEFVFAGRRKASQDLFVLILNHF